MSPWLISSSGVAVSTDVRFDIPVALGEAAVQVIKMASNSCLLPGVNQTRRGHRGMSVETPSGHDDGIHGRPE